MSKDNLSEVNYNEYPDIGVLLLQKQTDEIIMDVQMRNPRVVPLNAIFVHQRCKSRQTGNLCVHKKLVMVMAVTALDCN